MARPLWTPTDAQRRQAETMAAYGIPEADIARMLGVSKPTLRKHCGTELDTGATRANSFWSGDRSASAARLWVLVSLQPPRVFIQKIAAVTRARSSLNA